MGPTGATFDPPGDFPIGSYLAQSFSVLRGRDGESHQIRLRFSAEVARYVGERTWHPSQAVEPLAHGGLILTLTVSHLREVERFALSWGDACEVLAPEGLRQRIAQAIARAARFYLSDD